MPTPTVSTSSTTPMPMSAARWMPVASPNWLAMMLASVSPGPKMFALMCCELPMSERHRDRLADGAAEADDHRRRRRRRGCAGTPSRGSSPSGSRRARSAASFSGCGVVANTSRVSDVMIGVIMMATMIPAVMKLRPVGLGIGGEVAEDRDARRGRRDARRRCRRAVRSAPRSAHRPYTTDGIAASRSTV